MSAAPENVFTDFRTPEQEQAQKGAGVAPADELALEDLNPLNANLFRENRWARTFERLRAEDPFHFNEIDVPKNVILDIRGRAIRNRAGHV